MNTKTDVLNISKTEYDAIWAHIRTQDERLDELDRYLGTIETYGAYNNRKPDYSHTAKRNMSGKLDK
jgi:hypothetical protein